MVRDDGSLLTLPVAASLVVVAVCDSELTVRPP